MAENMVMEVSPGIFRGPRVSLLSACLKYHVKAVLDLQSSWDNSETMICSRYNVVKYTLAMCPAFPPSKALVKDALDLIYLAIYENRLPIYVHCRKGCDRTGFVIARYRIEHEGWSRNAAREEMIAMGNSWWLRWWTWFL